MTAHGGPFDITLGFGHRVDWAADEEPTMGVHVVMSWEHAISMMAVLERQIRQYEDQVPSLASFRQRIIDPDEPVAVEEET